jgi:hypothetical protein
MRYRRQYQVPCGPKYLWYSRSSNSEQRSVKVEAVTSWNKKNSTLLFIARTLRRMTASRAGQGLSE